MFQTTAVKAVRTRIATAGIFGKPKLATLFSAKRSKKSPADYFVDAVHVDQDCLLPQSAVERLRLRRRQGHDGCGPDHCPQRRKGREGQAQETQPDVRQPAHARRHRSHQRVGKKYNKAKYRSGRPDQAG